ncbi:MAG: hypothetical protein U5K81_10355 [Trueperaceae bacterium]|nr:hypothetical protein [Trueperaceae bacterium]
MTDRETIIVDHILASRTNTFLAFDLAAALPKAQHRLINQALQALENRLRDQAYGQDAWIQNTFDSGASEWPAPFAFKIRPTHWPIDLVVAIAAERDHTRQMSIGLHSDAEWPTIPQPALEALDSVRPTRSRPYRHWPWWRWLECDYRHWTTRAALHAFMPSDEDARHTKAQAVQELFLIVDELIRAADPHLRVSDEHSEFRGADRNG